MSIWHDKFCQFILLFSLFLLLFIDPTAFFGIIHKSHYTISVNFLSLSTILLAKSFQFQQNMRIPNPKHESWPLTINYYYLLILAACLLFTKVSITTTLVKDQLRNTEKILTSTILFYTICIKYNFLKTSIEFGTL